MLKMLNAHNAMRTVLENRRITLELALRQLAQTVGGQAPDQEEIAAFFHDFMDGYWDAFEEATSHDSDDLRSYNCRKKSRGLWGRNIRMCSASMNALQTAV